MALRGWGYLIAAGARRRYRSIFVLAVFERRSIRIAVSKAAQKYPHPRRYLRLRACLEREHRTYSIVRLVAVTGIGKLTLNLVRRFNRTTNA